MASYKQISTWPNILSVATGGLGEYLLFILGQTMNNSFQLLYVFSCLLPCSDSSTALGLQCLSMLYIMPEAAYLREMVMHPLGCDRGTRRSPFLLLHRLEDNWPYRWRAAIQISRLLSVSGG